MDPVALKTAYNKFVSLTGDLPSPDHECTTEQLSALQALAKAGSPLYVDLAVWGPHHYRLLKKIKLSGLQIMPDGGLRVVELAGPPTFEMWEKCMQVFRTGCLMLGLLTSSRIDSYVNVIKAYNSRYTHACWHLVYQADVRMRLEHTERIRRRGESEHARATAVGKHHEFDPNNHWEWVWSVIPDEQRFWREELEEPCLLVLARAGNLNKMVQGDAPVAGSPDAAAGSPAKQKRERSGSGAPPSQPPPKLHNVADGAYTTNRRGVPLCAAFQAGSCEGVGRDFRCARDHSRVHQCSKCLSTDHGASSCTRTPQAPSLPRSKGRGKGKKGKGRRSQF